MVNQVNGMGCVGYGGPQTIDACQLNIENVAYVKNDLYPNTYNPSWRDHVTPPPGSPALDPKGGMMSTETFLL